MSAAAEAERHLAWVWLEAERLSNNAPFGSLGETQDYWITDIEASPTRFVVCIRQLLRLWPELPITFSEDYTRVRITGKPGTQKVEYKTKIQNRTQILNPYGKQNFTAEERRRPSMAKANNLPRPKPRLSGGHVAGPTLF